MASITKKYTIEIRLECDNVSQSTVNEYFEQEMRQRLLKEFKNLKYFNMFFPDAILDPYASDPYKENDISFHFYAEEVK